MEKYEGFIKSIQINKIRHLHDLKIDISEENRRHLILTGPNGCGKTSLLRGIRDYLDGARKAELSKLAAWEIAIATSSTLIANSEADLENIPAGDANKRSKLQTDIGFQRDHIQNIRMRIEKFSYVIPDMGDLFDLEANYANGKFLLAFFDSKRLAQIRPVTGAQKLELEKSTSINVTEKSAGSHFLQFLVNQKNRAALFHMKGDDREVANINSWMDGITQKFRTLFQDDRLELDYDIDNFNFNINIPGREPFGFVDNQLSDGFSSVLQIVSEILMRMEANGSSDHTMRGIVLIDEIETHLHIKLQKAILPFLTNFFPNIQFIVTTHSPFVLTSLTDAVIFDLETRDRWENMSSMSASTVIEEYFDSDLYSDEIKNIVSRYADLTRLPQPSIDERNEILTIRSQLEALNYDSSPELVAQYLSIRAKEASN